MADKKKEATPAPLSTMLGAGDKFTVNDKEYIINPITLKDINAFTEEQLSMGSQIFNLMDEKTKAVLEKWIQKYITDSEGNQMTIQRMTDEDWNVVDLKNAIQRLIDVSG